MIIAALVMLAIGWVLLFLQVLRVLPYGLGTSFFAYSVMVLGLLAGLVGVVGISLSKHGD